MIRESRIETSTYENVTAVCPDCHFANVFNRASDLRTFRPIDLLRVKCQKCDKPFSLSGDSINVGYEMRLFEGRELIERKQYMQCALALAQAYEMFFRHFLDVQLLFRPFSAVDCEERDLAHLNRLCELLCERLHGFTFDPMRRLVLRAVVDRVAPQSLNEAEAFIHSIPEKSRDVPLVCLRDLEQVTDPKLKDLLEKLLRSDAHTIRNKVVHKDAYRPSRAEAERAFAEAREVLFGLGVRLDVSRDFEWYGNRPLGKR